MGCGGPPFLEEPVLSLSKEKGLGDGLKGNRYLNIIKRDRPKYQWGSPFILNFLQKLSTYSNQKLDFLTSDMFHDCSGE